MSRSDVRIKKYDFLSKTNRKKRVKLARSIFRNGVVRIYIYIYSMLEINEYCIVEEKRRRNSSPFLTESFFSRSVSGSLPRCFFASEQSNSSQERTKEKKKQSVDDRVHGIESGETQTLPFSNRHRQDGL